MWFGMSLMRLQHHIMRVKPNKKLQVVFKKWQILKGDQVQVRAGSDKGKVGHVKRVFRKANAIIVEGVNMRVKFYRGESEEALSKLRPCRIHVSNVGLHDPEINKPVKIKYGFNPETDEKLRISKKTGRIIEKPSFDNLKRENKGKNRGKGIKDTPSNLAMKVTYEGEDFEKVRQQFEQFIAEKERRERNLVFLQ